ncbi:PAS-domain containing protein [Sphingomonas sp.]|uniref:PAS-domain containing protein n=1 Tax=Sphingomonas sp. TaxID=28214 RepID=UPI0025D9B7C0|nr:PAS-domain containing protein [Sphingomonas sp.]
MHGVPQPIVAIAALLFAALLFLIAHRAERRHVPAAPDRRRQAAQALALGVYCTSWTFYGAVGTAASDGWSYLPIYLGPILVYALAPGLVRAIARAARDEGATSVSDLIGARFGKSRGLAALVTVTATLGAVPYIALQLRSIGQALSATAGPSGALASVIAGAVLALFALAFGTRRYDVAGRNEGLLFATAADSLFKLAALAGIALLALLLLTGDPRAAAAGGTTLAAMFAPARLGSDTLVITLIAMAAVLSLPRQFYIGVIEARGLEDVRASRWPFIAYVGAMALLVPPIAVAGALLLPPGTAPDGFVVALPMAAGSTPLTLLALLGGFSAATAMVVVETVALATMISNDLIAPLLLARAGWTAEADLGARLLGVRRLAVIVVIALALGWGEALGADYRLAAIGHIAFAAMAQFTPLLLIAARGRGHDPRPAKLALALGTGLWLYTLALPPILPAGLLAALGGTFVDPRHLFGLGAMTPLTHGVVWSLGANLLLLALLSARGWRRVAVPGAFEPRVAAVGDMAGLIAFAGRFVGMARAAAAFADAPPSAPVGSIEARRAERLIASVVGVPSARALVAAALAGARLSYADIVRMLDEGGQSLQFSQGLLAATLEHIDPGVSVVDSDLRLIAWNSRYLALFAYPPGLVRVGTPVAELIRYNAVRGECGPGEVEAHVARRLAHLKRGLPHGFERIRPDGRVFKTVGGPMPGGGYVMCFTDVTAEAQALAALEASRAELEARVAERTAELTRLNEKLAAATAAKTRFLAAASHDLLQPLHAARLFTSALARDGGGDGQLVERIGQSIGAAEELLRALLDISKLDAGGIEPRPQAVALAPLLAEVVGCFRPLAEEAGLTLRLGPAYGSVTADPALLRSIVQNFVSNAVRYTARGGVLVGVRPAGEGLSIWVSDTGPGIPADKQALIFREFERLGTRGVAGIGLGLAIVERSARLIDGRILLRSVEGRGSSFAIALPRASAAPAALRPVPAVTAPVSGQRVLVVDDDPRVVEATLALLERDGHDALGTGSVDAALATAADVALVDHDLGAPLDGLALIERLRGRGMRCALVTASGDAALRTRAGRAGVPLFAKPVAPDALRAWLALGEAVAAE